MMRKTLYLITFFALSSISAFAQDSTATSPLTITGYADSYYFYNLNNPLSRSNLGVSGFERAFDQRAGEFKIGLVQTKFAYSNSKSDVVVDLTFGPNADLGNYGNVVGPLSLPGDDRTTTSLAIKQAYLTYKFTPKFNFTIGQFGTHIGYEVIDAPVNYNYSLSNLFNNGPFYHTGLKLNYAISDKVGLMVGVVNNWDALYDNNKYKTGVAQLFLSPVEGWNIYLNWIGGNEETTDGDTTSFKQMIDLTTGFQLTDKFYLGLNFAEGFYKVEDADVLNWGGVALYANYAISDVFGLGVRGEYFDNTSGAQYIKSATGSGTSVTSLTVTGNFTLADGHILIKPEFRLDAYKELTGPVQQFQDSDGAFTKNSQSTLGAAFIYKF